MIDKKKYATLPEESCLCVY